MRPETAGCLADALLAAERILAALHGKSLEQYVADWMLESVVERQFLVLGEAIVRVRQLEPTIFDQLPESDSMIRFRNVLVHIYDQIDSARVFRIALDELPQLVPVLKGLVSQAESEGL